MVSYSLYTDQELASRMRAGDELAFAEVYDRWWDKCLDSAYKRLGESAAAEDVVQNLFTRLWESRLAVEIHQFGPYLMKSVRNGVLDHIAKRKTSERFFSLFEAVLPETAAAKSTADEKLVAGDLLKWVLAYGETLPEKRKQVFVAHVRDRMSKKEIAAQMGIDLKTVERHLLLALRGLRNQLDNDYNQELMVALILAWPFLTQTS